MRVSAAVAAAAVLTSAFTSVLVFASGIATETGGGVAGASSCADGVTEAAAIPGAVAASVSDAVAAMAAAAIASGAVLPGLELASAAEIVAGTFVTATMTGIATAIASAAGAIVISGLISAES